jgi:hypothetical protein
MVAGGGEESPASDSRSRYRHLFGSPKVIASTATIKNADVQVRSLFLRTVNIFPPPGLDVRDNFFSVQREPTGEGVWPAVSSASCAAGSPAEGGV